MKRLLVAAMVLAALGAARLEAANVTVTEIKASGSGGSVTIDPALAEIADKIAKQFRYSSYSMLSRKPVNVSTGLSATWKLADGNSLDVTVAATEDDAGTPRHTLILEVYTKTASGKKSISKITLKNPKGGTFLLGVGESKALGGTLILAVKTD